MTLLATNAELWSIIGTAIVTIFLLVPGLVYAWFVLDSWVGDDEGYARVVASIEER
jgi:hypothetical protein